MPRGSRRSSACICVHRRFRSFLRRHHFGPGQGVVVGTVVTAEHPRPRLGVVRRLHSEERGVVTVIATLTLLALMGMLALSVDIGYAYGQRRLAQNVADSGAMAGAWVI